MTFRKILFICLSTLCAGFSTLIIFNASTQSEILNAIFLAWLIVLIYLMCYAKFLSTTFFFLVFYSMLFLVQPTIYKITKVEYNTLTEIVKLLIFLTIIGVYLFTLGNVFFSNKTRLNLKVVINFKKITKAIRLVFLVSIFSLSLLAIDAGTLNILQLGRLELKNSGSMLRTLATYGLYISSIMFFLVFFTFRNRKTLNKFSWILLLVIFETIVFLFFRTRSLLVVHLAAGLVGYYYSYAYIIESKIKPKLNKFGILVLGVFIGIIAISFRFFRGYLQPTSKLTDFDFDLQLFLQKSVESGDLGYSTNVYKVLDLVPHTYDYLYGSSYFRLLFIAIPRQIWAAKPKNTETMVGSWLYPGVEGMSVPPGIIGDLFINFGVFGILGMFIFGVFFSFLDFKVSSQSIIVWGVSATWIFHLVRGGFTNPVLIFLVLLVSIVLINKICEFNVKEKERKKTTLTFENYEKTPSYYDLR